MRIPHSFVAAPDLQGTTIVDCTAFLGQTLYAAKGAGRKSGGRGKRARAERAEPDFDSGALARGKAGRRHVLVRRTAETFVQTLSG